MNILSGFDEQFKNEVLSLLKSMNLEMSWMNKAEKFFDFSKEMDTGLLEGKRNYSLELWSAAVDAKAKKIVSDIQKQSDTKYSDRYILFMDAIDAVEKMVYQYYDFKFDYNNSDYSNDLCYHAFSLVCEDDFKTRAKLYANMFPGNYYYSGSNFEGCKQVEIAEKNPRFIYEAAKSHNKLRFFALALCFAKNNKFHLFSHNKDNVFSNSEINEMTSYILEQFKAVNPTTVNNTETESYKFFMSVMFMTRNHSKEINSILTKKISGHEEAFLLGVIKNVPSDYFNENLDSLFDILKNYVSTDIIIKSTVLAAYKSNVFTTNGISGLLEKNALDMLAYEAKKYPDEYFSVMRSRDKMTGINAMGFVPDYYYIFYDHMFDILEKENPKASKRLSADRYNDMVELFIQTEKDVSQAPEEVGQYLNGEKDISVLIPKHDIIALNTTQRTFTDYHVRYIIYALRNTPEYLERYIAYKTIQNPYNITDYAREIIRSMRVNNTSSDRYYNLIESLVNEKVPVADRFSLYQNIDNSCFYGDDPDRNKLIEIYTEKMLSYSETNDEEYEQLADMKNVYARKLYAIYLGKTDTCVGNHKKMLLKMCGDSSKEVRREIINSVTVHKELENDVKEMLTAKKQAFRETAIEILNNWGALDYTDILTKAAETDKSTKVADRIRDILGKSSVKVSDNKAEKTSFSPDEYIKAIHKGGRARKIQWLYEVPLPHVHKNDGTLADDTYMQAIILSYTALSYPERPTEADKLANKLDKKELEAFAAEIFSRWYNAGAEAKKKQLMYFAAAYGGNDLIDEMLKCIKNWSSWECARGAIAAETIKGIALNGSSKALMAVDNISHKFKHKQVRFAAVEAMGKAAEILGITPDELGDKIVPDLDFDIERKRIFDYGTRKFNVYLTYGFALEVTDQNGKMLKTLPSPGKNDDEEKAKAEYSEFKQLKKELKSVVSIQSSRLETVLISDRRWNKSNWEKLFIQNPIMQSFAEELIWAAYSDDKCISTFRYMEDGTFNTADCDEFELPDNCTVGLIHPLELDDDTLSAWKEQLSDYEIKQPFLQLERPVFRINEDEKGKYDVERFSGRTISAYSIIGRTEKLGWYKGSVQDGGGFFEFYREDITSREKLSDGTEKLSGHAAEFSFSGCSVGYYDEDVTIENIRFYHPGTVKRGSYVYDKADNEKAIILDKVDPRYFSEIIYQLEQITTGKQPVS